MKSFGLKLQLITRQAFVDESSTMKKLQLSLKAFVKAQVAKALLKAHVVKAAKNKSKVQ
jgi:hypothetical protein